MPSTWLGSSRSTPRRASRSRRFTRRTSPATPGSTGPSPLLIDFIKTYLGPTFAQRSLTAEIWCGTMSKDPDDTNIAKATAIDPAALQYVKGFGVQWNLQAAVATLAHKGPVLQTEHRCGNYNFASPYWDQSRYNANKPQNDHLYGEESWQLIRDWIVSGVNAYSAWNMVLDTIGKSLDAWPQNALLVGGPLGEEADRDAGLLRLPALLPVHRRRRDAHRDQRQQRRARLQEPRRQHRRARSTTTAARRRRRPSASAAPSRRLCTGSPSPPTAGTRSAFRRDEPRPLPADTSWSRRIR